MDKPAPTTVPLAAPIRARWSPRAFAATVPTDAELRSLLEAARWAASCVNEQPWRFIVAVKGRGDAWQRLFDCLAAGNQSWCAAVPVLMLSVAVPGFRRNGNANRHAQHDVGMASAQLAVQAADMGLAVHFMAGFDVDRARAAFAIPADHQPMAAIAVGHPGDPATLTEEQRGRELAPRARLELGEIAFAGDWGRPFVPD
ncbi:MAG: nitroreductase family protein [Geminicoccaceae bacterium]